ncbi:thioredoxin family protein [Ornithinibacillus gellani]|uniref:thioredoxin family protein n=1 Tax=Ornithinibacillus gellani TaxID=2293253 RepID=UPI000F4A8D52|nr:thioredoxin family protein [Ornithinibacillus gellani]TQS76619.1 thioredoxin family protein [Ornithinibacillus gellani]
MKKKMFVFLGIIVLLFVGLYMLNSYKNNQLTNRDDNPYGDKKLDQATIDQLDDPNYGNQILPDELDEKVSDGDAMTVYFYSPTCSYCRATTPILVPAAEDEGIDVKKMNVLEFQDEWNKWGLEATPTLIHFEDGEEVARLVGQQTKEEFIAFFDEYVK